MTKTALYTVATLVPGHEPVIYKEPHYHDAIERAYYALNGAMRVCGIGAPIVWCGPECWSNDHGRAVGGYDAAHDVGHRVSAVIYAD